MAELNKKLKAFTLIETIVAMAIVMISIGIAMTIFVNVRNSAKSAVRLKAMLAMEKIAFQSMKEQLFLDDRYEYEGYHIEKSCYPYAEGSNAIVVVLESYLENGRKIAERKEIALSPGL